MDNPLELNSDSYSPLFSFNTLVDTDLGLLNYVFKEFRNERYFDLNVLDYYELINKVYYRSNENPLCVIMKNPESAEDRQFLDECYSELLQMKEAEILQNSIGTQLIELLKIFQKEGNIISHIMYYTPAQKQFLLNMKEFDNIDLVNCEDISKHNIKISYSQFYIKYLEELYLLDTIQDKTIYVSSCGLNLDEKHQDLKDIDILNDAIDRHNQINIIDLYRSDIIGKDIYRT